LDPRLTNLEHGTARGILTLHHETATSASVDCWYANHPKSSLGAQVSRFGSHAVNMNTSWSLVSHPSDKRRSLLLLAIGSRNWLSPIEKWPCSLGVSSSGNGQQRTIPDGSKKRKVTQGLSVALIRFAINDITWCRGSRVCNQIKILARLLPLFNPSESLHPERG
jgi:hypothetical protein